MKTVLIYVLSVRSSPYEELMHSSMGTWDKALLPGTETVYYCGTPHGKQMAKVHQMSCPEGLNNMARKNIPAFSWALKLKWDYMARVNASCYVRKQLLLDEVQRLPDTNVFRGVGAGAFMWGGAQFIMSRDVVQKMIENQHLCDVRQMDDVALSLWAKGIGVPWDTKGRACAINQQGDKWLCLWYADGKQGGIHFTDFSELRKLDNQYFIRVKQDLKRDEDIRIMKELDRCGI